jgi:EAL domain-containing protein (putative c-di-GMP-specific phosphodiesterase class I)
MAAAAEGVETQDDWNALHCVGVDLAQGYLIARPMAAEQIPVWLAQWPCQYSGQLEAR